MDVASVSGDPQATNGSKIIAMMGFLDEVLLPESAALFAERFRDPTNPITIEQATDVVTWLASEVYSGGRPTGRSSASANGQPLTGQSSTVAAPSSESTPSDSTPDDSST